jgi:hypothetical protein
MKVYNIKSLVSGHRIKTSQAGKTLVCCRNDKGYTHIKFGSKIMKIEGSPICELPFTDKYGRGSYFLAYYEWKPVTNLWDLNVQPELSTGINRLSTSYPQHKQAQNTKLSTSTTTIFISLVVLTIQYLI